MIRLFEGDAERFADLWVVVTDTNRRLELGLQHRQRGAELVACIGDEPPLALKGLLQAGEHLVQRLAETADLILRGWERQPLASAGQRDPRRPLAHRLDRRQTGRRKPVADPGREQHSERTADQEGTEQARQRLVAVFERRPATTTSGRPAAATGARASAPFPRCLERCARTSSVPAMRAASPRAEAPERALCWCRPPGVPPGVST